MDQQRQAAALEETALSFTGVIALGTCLCCTTMSCVALCIKLVTWIFGQRRPRRILIGHTHQDHDNRVPAYNPLDHHHHHHQHHHPNSNCAEQRIGSIHISDIEMRQVPFRNIVEPLENNGGGRPSNRFATAADIDSTGSPNSANENGRKPTVNGPTSDPRLKELEDDERFSTHEDGDDDGGEEQDSGHGRLGG